jgi:hypothetical protein
MLTQRRRRIPGRQSLWGRTPLQADAGARIEKPPVPLLEGVSGSEACGLQKRVKRWRWKRGIRPLRKFEAFACKDMYTASGVSIGDRPDVLEAVAIVPRKVRVVENGIDDQAARRNAPFNRPILRQGSSVS